MKKRDDYSLRNPRTDGNLGRKEIKNVIGTAIARRQKNGGGCEPILARLFLRVKHTHHQFFFPIFFRVTKRRPLIFFFTNGEKKRAFLSIKVVRSRFTYVDLRACVKNSSVLPADKRLSFLVVGQIEDHVGKPFLEVGNVSQSV